MNGLLIINKPINWTSRDVVNKVGHILNTSKIGHTGTLDPIATGVLVLAIGEGLKLVDLVTSETKEYIATAKVGIQTDTLDITGNVLKESNELKKKEELENVLKSFIGKYLQEVPLYSSVKVNGRRLYDYARNNIEVELPKREVEIFDIELLSFKDDEFSFRVSVSKGTYIRSLIRDIGNKLNVFCTMKSLERTKQGDFCIEDSYDISDIEKGSFELVSFNKALSRFKTVEVDEYLEKKVSNGVPLENRYDEEYIVFINKDSKVLAIYRETEDKKRIKPYKVFNL